MREMASTIKNGSASRAERSHQTASDFIGVNTLTSQVGSYRLTFWAKVESHTSCARSFERDESLWNSSVREGKSDCSYRRSHANVHVSAEEALGMWLKDMAEVFSKRHSVDSRWHGVGWRMLS